MTKKPKPGFSPSLIWSKILTQQPDYQVARNYWKVLKNRLAKEGSQSVTNCNRLKLQAADGKSYLTDVANAETLLRLIQSVPSWKAEPINRLWSRIYRLKTRSVSFAKREIQNAPTCSLPSHMEPLFQV